MCGYDSEAEEAQRDYEHEVDKEAARLIREEGIPLWNATERAQQNIKKIRQAQRCFGKQGEK